jgi:hypothetical protein
VRPDEQQVDRRVLRGMQGALAGLEAQPGGGEQLERGGAIRPFEGTATRRRPSSLMRAVKPRLVVRTSASV